MGIVPRKHPRIRQNLDAIERELADGPPSYATLPEETGDGFHRQLEAAFTLLGFWLIGNLIQTRQTGRAFDYYNQAITTQGNHFGIFAEMYDNSTGRQLGNFAQAFSHIGLIHNAPNLSGYINHTLTRRPNRSNRNTVD